MEGFRVVDASIFTSLNGGNTNAPTMIVAKRGSDWIKEKFQ
ncbi:GMC oxidoreductase [Psychrobium sp. 1_MG-2023]|nr:GMC oxidoreductase [Psychrobium sp. 1_MG-2023]MDP2559750.1 GMC oxidoreductase [Psychrobium sp. 1_MG-2023]